MENTKDRSNGRVGPSVIGREMPQMFASAKLAIVVNRVKPERPRQRGIKSAESRQDKLRRWVGCNYKPDDLNRCNRRVRTRMPGGVGGAEPSGSPLSRLGFRQEPSRTAPDGVIAKPQAVAIQVRRAHERHGLEPGPGRCCMRSHWMATAPAAPRHDEGRTSIQQHVHAHALGLNPCFVPHPASG